MKATIKSHIGKRETNQDFVATFTNLSNQILAILCDGMGGHNAGDIASEMAVLQLGNSWKKSEFNEQEIHSAEQWLREHINKENKRIYDAATVFQDLNGMGTTLVAAVIFEDSTLVANVGDSRAYVLEASTLNKVTEDHSFANELKLNGQITEEEALIHEKRNTLTRSLGIGSNVIIDFFYLSNTRIQNLLLCSDGLTNAINETEIQTLLSQRLTDLDKVELLVKNALSQGASDNITVCLIEYNSSESIDMESTIGEGGSSDGNR
ncbi:Stp1/IreP family PP2C-type Ser/Thr phosphatase [Marinilactibacillus psychrotolerans]|uniref:Stp1/IreP family PP2C-type Ser/Thr phosphatase n=1 Tax=Marinilactibacillus psychrotolerans TaxID=191770 RepID=UPI000B884C35